MMRRINLRLTATMLFAAALVAGCDQSGNDQSGNDQAVADTTTVSTVSAEEQKMPTKPETLKAANQGSSDELKQRYAEIKTLIGEAKASDVQQCRKVAFGYKACGGPASYLIYSVQGLDEAVLLNKVNEYNAMAKAEAQRLGLMSDCAMVLEPSVTLVEGVCKAGPAGNLF